MLSDLISLCALSFKRRSGASHKSSPKSSHKSNFVSLHASTSIAMSSLQALAYHSHDPLAHFLRTTTSPFIGCSEKKGHLLSVFFPPSPYEIVRNIPWEKGHIQTPLWKDMRSSLRRQTSPPSLSLQAAVSLLTLNFYAIYIHYPRFCSLRLCCPKHKLVGSTHLWTELKWPLDRAFLYRIRRKHILFSGLGKM